MKIYSISPTGLELYDHCPHCFFLKSKGIPQTTTEAMSFGIKVHDNIQRYHQDQSVLFFDPEVEDYLEEYAALYDRSYELCEERLKVPLFDTGINMTFKIDLVKDQIIYEHKTSRSWYSQEFVDSHRQATAYSYGFRSMYGGNEKAIVFNVFNTKVEKDHLKTFETQRTEQDFLDFYEWVKDILYGIESDIFPTKPAPFHLYAHPQ